MDISTFAAPLAALAFGEALSSRLSRHLSNEIIRYLQKHVRAGQVGASFPAMLRDRMEACISVAAGIPTFYLTIIALRGVPSLESVPDWVGYAVAVVVPIAMLKYGYGSVKWNIASKKLLHLSLPSATLLAMNVVGLVFLLA